MRLDKWLKFSRLIKRRTVAQLACDQGRVFVNNRPAKSSAIVRVGDIIHIEFGSSAITAKVLAVPAKSPSMQEASSLYEIKEVIKRQPENLNYADRLDFPSFCWLALMLSTSLGVMLFFSSFAYAKESKIFSLSTQQESSQILGIRGVPAYVILPQGSRRGCYITGVSNSGMWREMRLYPGSLLLTLGCHVIEKASLADTVLKNTTCNFLDFTYVRNFTGKPQITTSRIPYHGQDSALAMTAGTIPTITKNTIAKNHKEPEEAISSLETYMVGLINRDRANNGALPPLTQNMQLHTLARSYAEYMLKAGFFAHVDPQGRNPQMRARQASITCGIAENLAFQSRGLDNDSKLVQAAQISFMDEPPNQQNHRANILNPDHLYVGIGIARNAQTLMIVQEFTKELP